jgi:hypothetical protein
VNIDANGLLITLDRELIACIPKSTTRTLELRELVFFAIEHLLQLGDFLLLTQCLLQPSQLRRDDSDTTLLVL